MLSATTSTVTCTGKENPMKNLSSKHRCRIVVTCLVRPNENEMKHEAFPMLRSVVLLQGPYRHQSSMSHRAVASHSVRSSCRRACSFMWHQRRAANRDSVVVMKQPSCSAERECMGADFKNGDRRLGIVVGPKGKQMAVMFPLLDFTLLNIGFQLSFLFF